MQQVVKSRIKGEKREGQWDSGRMNVGTQTGGLKSGVEKWRSGYPERNGSAHSDVLADRVDGGVGRALMGHAALWRVSTGGEGMGVPFFLGGL